MLWATCSSVPVLRTAEDSRSTWEYAKYADSASTTCVVEEQTAIIANNQKRNEVGLYRICIDEIYVVGCACSTNVLKEMTDCDESAGLGSVCRLIVFALKLILSLP